MNENKTKELSYLLLQHKYMEKYKLDTNDDILVNNNFFPEGWFSMGFEQRIEILQQALRTNQTINEIMYANSKIK